MSTAHPGRPVIPLDLTRLEAETILVIAYIREVTARMLETYNNRALLVDLYELTMAAAYFEHRIDCRATFELFVRQLPPERGYLVAAGLDSALGYLENLRFTDDDVRFLREQPAFRTVSDSFFRYLRQFRFTGEVRAIPEGTLVFGGEPILQVTAPVAEAQVIETYLLSVINFETNSLSGSWMSTNSVSKTNRPTVSCT